MLKFMDSLLLCLPKAFFYIFILIWFDLFFTNISFQIISTIIMIEEAEVWSSGENLPHENDNQRTHLLLANKIE